MRKALLIFAAALFCAAASAQAKQVASFSGEKLYNGERMLMTLAFRADGTFSLRAKMSDTFSERNLTLGMTLDAEVAEGTYSGNPTKDGGISLSVLRAVDFSLDFGNERIEERVSAAFTQPDVLEKLGRGEDVRVEISLADDCFPLEDTEPIPLEGSVSGDTITLIDDAGTDVSLTRD